MRLDPVAQRRLAQRLGDEPAAERELDVVEPVGGPVARQHLPALVPHVLGHPADADRLEVGELGVPADALEEGDGEAGALSRGGGEDAVRGRDADALGQLCGGGC